MLLLNKGRRDFIGVEYKTGEFAVFKGGTTMEVQDKEAEKLLDTYPKFIVNASKTAPIEPAQARTVVLTDAEAEAKAKKAKK